jgi:hypothetical protein
MTSCKSANRNGDIVSREIPLRDDPSQLRVHVWRAQNVANSLCTSKGLMFNQSRL